MTMTLEPNQQRYALPFDSMSSSYSNHHPQFTNPWSTAPPSHGVYAGSAHVAHGGIPSNSHQLGLDRHSQQPSSRGPATTTAPLAQYGSVPVTAASAGSPLSMMDPSIAGQADLLSGPQDLISMSRMPHATTAAYADTAYHTTAASPVHPTYAASPTSYEPLAYPRHNNFGLPAAGDHHQHSHHAAAAAAAAAAQAQAQAAADAQSRRYSQSSVSSSASYEPVDLAAAAALPQHHRVGRTSLVDFRTDRGISDDPRGFREALEASQGMLSMKFAETGSQETPRAGVYNSRGRGSGDSYGFPSTHSSTSSVSSTGFSPYSYTGSVDGSEYSTAGSDIESVGGSRTLPRPQGLMPTQQPPAPQSMMGQFSSKVSSSTQKKHKCKVCDKRFTRPSSLQTHMYSHTGEKRESLFSLWVCAIQR